MAVSLSLLLSADKARGPEKTASLDSPPPCWALGGQDCSWGWGGSGDGRTDLVRAGILSSRWTDPSKKPSPGLGLQGSQGDCGGRWTTKQGKSRHIHVP